jgi:glucose-6-phosphate 1-epimerase
MNLESLNSNFAIDGQLEFVEGQGGLILVKIRNALGEALVSTYAGQVLNYRPTGEEEDLLFLSGRAYFEDGKAIKGGVPVCWPWFGPDPQGLGRPAHGFVRNRQWDVIATEQLQDGSTRLVLGLESNDETRAIWANEFQLRIAIRVGASLKIELMTSNQGESAFELTQALHTYFNVGDIQRVQVLGLEGRQYIDKTDAGTEKSQSGPVVIEGEVDRIYKAVAGDLIIDDRQLGRRIRIGSGGSNSAVVWNPWVEIAAQMGDLADEDYRRLLCVETTNAADDLVSVNPGDTYSLVAEYRIEQGGA